MAESLEGRYRPLLEAASFAARAHRNQVRKDGRTPYVGHVVRVCLIARQVFGIEQPEALMAALLHDTIEDTDTDYDDLAGAFGHEVARWAALLCKDTRMPEEEREQDYLARLAGAPWQVKVCKLADIFDNLMDSRHLRPDQLARSRPRWLMYLDALGRNVPAEARRAYELTRGLYLEMYGAAAAGE